MPTYKQVVNHVKKHVLWKEEYLNAIIGSILNWFRSVWIKFIKLKMI